MKKARVFIGSSSEALMIAKALEVHLTSSCDTYIWDSSVFDLSQSALEDLEKKAGEYEYAILVLSPDDMLNTRGKTVAVPRDNVLFELGLFVGKIGRSRTFVVCDPNKIKMPSDWNGITVAKFDWDRAVLRGEAREALSPTSTEIIDAMRSAPSFNTIQTPIPSFAVRIPDQDELYNIIVGPSAARSGVLVLNTGTAWAWKLFPTILEWRRRGVPMSLLLTSPKGSEKSRRQEMYRRKLLVNLGANITETDELAFRAFLLDTEDEDNLDALVLVEDSTGYQPLALRYKATEHREAAIALLKRVKDSITAKTDGYIPKIEIFDEANVATMLKQSVSQYKSNGVNISFTTVPTAELFVISKYARSYKYQQLSYLDGIYKQTKIEPFGAFKVLLEDGTFSIATPPVVEKREEGLVVIEGNTRATYCYNKGLQAFPCLLVEGVVDPLPSVPFPISDVCITEQTLVPWQRMNAFEYGNFRHIERAVHPY